MPSAPLTRASKELWNEIRVAARTARSRRRFRALDGRRDLLLHLGCGGEIKPGWINVDLAPARSVRRTVRRLPAGTLFFEYDLRRGEVPLPDGSCARVYSSHFFEHLDYETGVRLMRDCHRVLRPGGVFRAALPTFRAMFRAYLDGDAGYFEGVALADVRPEVEPETATLLDHVQYGVYQYGEHKCLYDEDKLCRVLKRLGFEARAVPYDPEVDATNDLRRRYSFFVEGVK
jgi:predicted SAM-dependent methyltransferase